MKKLVYTFVSVVGLYGFVPVNGFAQHKQDQVVAQPDTTKQNYHVLGFHGSETRQQQYCKLAAYQQNDRTLVRAVVGHDAGTCQRCQLYPDWRNSIEAGYPWHVRKPYIAG